MQIRIVGIVGCGTMGAGIAQVMLQGGCDVIACEPDETFLKRGIERIDSSFELLVKKSKISADKKADLLKNLKGTTKIEDLKGCDLVIEAVFEDMQVKIDLFKTLDAVCGSDTIFASNTSSMSITKMAGVTSRPGQVVGMHFFNPVFLMPLVEVVKTIATNQDLIDQILDFVKSIGKIPVVARDDSGFIVNALMTPYLLDAMRAVSNGVASISDIDAAIKYGMNHPLGPLMLSDIIGLDLLYTGSTSMLEEYRDNRYAPPPILKKMIMMNYLGKKTGKGFYDWSDPKNPKPMTLYL